MDTSATVRKVSTEKEKEEYRKAGRCFECGKQGHLVRVCPSKKNRSGASARIVPIEESSDELPLDENDAGLTPTTMAALAMKFSDEERDLFVKKLQEMGAKTGFQQVNVSTLIRAVGTGSVYRSRNKAIKIPFALRTKSKRVDHC